MVANVTAEIVGQLREAIVRLEKTATYKEIVEPKDEVLARFQPVFAPEHIPEIAGEEFWAFLLVDNNHHWSGLHRHASRMCSDKPKLREALSILVDETRPVGERLNRVVDMVSGMGKNVATAILTVVQPDLYGVWNNRPEASMKQLGIWPKFDRGESFGSRYIKVNQLLLQLRDSLHIDLWTLDALWWYLDQEATDIVSAGDTKPSSVESEQRFGLERHLHEFLRDNWYHLELGQEWMLYQEPGDEEAGYEYPCDVGRIDLLAKHKNHPHWLVVELKRNQTSDQTVGQLLRYIGWVKQHLAEEGEKVYGMIICHEADDALFYALSTVPNVELRLYEVEFHLKKLQSVPETKG